MRIKQNLVLFIKSLAVQNVSMVNPKPEMRYRIELKTEPETWTIKMFQEIQRAAIQAKKEKLEMQSKVITDKLLNKVKNSLK